MTYLGWVTYLRNSHLLKIQVPLRFSIISFSDKPIAKKGTNAEVKAKRSSLNNSRINLSTNCPECTQLQLAETTRMTIYEYFNFHSVSISLKNFCLIF